MLCFLSVSSSPLQLYERCVCAALLVNFNELGIPEFCLTMRYNYNLLCTELSRDEPNTAPAFMQGYISMLPFEMKLVII
jgi:hypothetical protein